MDSNHTAMRIRYTCYNACNSISTSNLVHCLLSRPDSEHLLRRKKGVDYSIDNGVKFAMDLIAYRYHNLMCNILPILLHFWS